MSSASSSRINTPQTDSSSAGHAGIERLIGAARKAEQFMLSEFGMLRADQLNWKPDANSWSIGQCLDHIVVTDALYYPVFDKILEGTYQMNFWQKRSPLSGMFGRMLVNQMSEVAAKKYKSPRNFRPDTHPIGLEVITRFSKHQDTLITFMQALAPEKIRKIKISSPASGFVTYNLDHALQMIIQHQYRHLNQARRVKDQEGFPR